MRYIFHGLTALSILQFVPMAFGQTVDLAVPSGADINFDPFSGVSGSETVRIEISHLGTETLDAKLLISPEFGREFILQNAGGVLTFEINSALGNSGFSAFEAPITLAANGGTVSLNLNFRIHEGQYADAGHMNQDLSFVIKDALTLENLSPVHTLRLSANMPQRTQVNFAGASTGFENGIDHTAVDFGTLKSFDSRTLQFQIRGNSDVEASIRSENSGKLINSENPSLTPIPYTIITDGESSDLSVPLSFIRRPEKSLDGSSYPLEIKIGDVTTGTAAGQYRDMITVEVNSR